MKRVYIYILLCVALLSSATLTAQSISDELVYDRITGYMTSESNIGTEAKPSKNIQHIRWKHNIRIGYGAPSITSWMFTHDGFSAVCCDLGPMQQTLRERIHNSRYHESAERYLHSLYAEYTTSINPWFSIGAKCTFAAKWLSEYDSHTNELFARHNAYDIGATSILATAHAAYWRPNSLSASTGFLYWGIALYRKKFCQYRLPLLH